MCAMAACRYGNVEVKYLRLYGPTAYGSLEDIDCYMDWSESSPCPAFIKSKTVRITPIIYKTSQNKPTKTGINTQATAESA